MGWTCRGRLNTILSIWYSVITVGIQAYLIYLGFMRYTLYNDVKWPTGNHPYVWLVTYRAIYCICIPLTFLYFAFGFFKSGNIAGDNERLADREDRVIEISRNRKGEKEGCLHRIKVLWQHSPPMPQLLHLFIAAGQLVAQQLMIAQLYKSGFINSGDFLNTELDFIFQRARQLATNLPTGDSLYQGFRLTANELSDYPLSPNLLPLLMNARLFGIPLEFANFVVALIAYSVNYSAVFSRVNKCFSLVFSLHMFLFSISTIFSYISFSILFRIQETNLSSIRPVGLGQYIGHARGFSLTAYVYHPITILGTYVVSFFATVFSPIAVYCYGYNCYERSLFNLQSKNHIRSGSVTGASDYSNYTRKASFRAAKKQCCGGYGPHALGTAFFVTAVLTKFSTCYAFAIFFIHEAKPILLTCLAVEVVHMLVWIGLLLIFVLYHGWNFDVAHRAHQIYALQKGGVTGHVNGNENPSQLKNALIVIHRDHMFVSDDQNAKQNLLRHVQKGNQLDNAPEAYWGNHNGGGAQGSPLTRKVPNDEMVKGTPEMTRLMNNTSNDDTTSSYPTMSRASHLPPAPSSAMGRGQSSPPEPGFGTLQRGQQNQYMSTLQRGGTGTLQRSMQQSQWPPDSYASIHKQQKHDPYQRRGSNDGNQYGQTEIYSSAYGTYARIPNQARVAVPPPSQHVQAMRINGNNYGMSGTLQRRPSDSTHSQIGGVRQSPLLSERTPSSGIGTQSSIASNKDQSQYQRSGIKLTSFNNGEKGGVYGTAASHWAQRAPPGQPSQLLWNQNKATMSASSSQQDQCFTPTSTLTSQTSTSTNSQLTPTPGSPQTYTRNESGGGIYGTLGEEIYGEKTLQKRTGGFRQVVKPGPSVNFSAATLTNGSNGGSKDDFATSIV